MSASIQGGLPLIRAEHLLRRNPQSVGRRHQVPETRSSCGRWFTRPVPSFKNQTRRSREALTNLKKLPLSGEMICAECLVTERITDNEGSGSTSTAKLCVLTSPHTPETLLLPFPRSYVVLTRLARDEHVRTFLDRPPTGIPTHRSTPRCSWRSPSFS